MYSMVRWDFVHPSSDRSFDEPQISNFRGVCSAVTESVLVMQQLLIIQITPKAAKAATEICVCDRV
jgi:hypothetical protein